MQEVAKSDCRVLVVFNPVNSNTVIVQKYCSKLPKKNFISLM
ncbi:MAG: hypothetical protein ACK52J_02355 [bacterium]